MKRDKGWNAYASDFEAEVLNVVGHDRTRLIESALLSYMASGSIVGDYGCGIGWGVPLMAERAQHVYGIDIADSFLKVARKLKYSNVTWLQWDLSRRKLPPVPKFDAIMSLQVLITGEAKVRTGILNTIARSLKPGGHLIVTVPSLESQLWVYQNLYRKADSSKSGRAKTHKIIRDETRRLSQGLVRLDRFDTKFYLRPEIEADLGAKGFEVLEVQQLPYCWSEELLPAEWPHKPKPWSWLLVAKKI